MRDHRPKRVGVVIQQELTKILQRKFRFPASELVTITKIELSNDLQYGKVFFSVYGPPKEKERIAAELNKAAGYFRHTLGKRLHLLHIPDLHFEYDKNIEYAAHILEILEKER